MSSYRRLILDPRAFKPISNNINISIYNDAIDAINIAFEYANNKSEKKILNKLLSEVKRNKRGYYK
jgi:hypothetical protein